MMTWTHVREMHKGGMHFGSHTVTHPLLPSIPLDEARAEIAGSRQALEAELGVTVRHFSYPNPSGGIHWTPAVREIVREAGFATSVTSQSGYVQPGDDLLTIHRLNPSHSAQDLAWDIEGSAVRAALKSVAARGPGGRRARPRAGARFAPG